MALFLGKNNLFFLSQATPLKIDLCAHFTMFWHARKRIRNGVNECLSPGISTNGWKEGTMVSFKPSNPLSPSSEISSDQWVSQDPNNHRFHLLICFFGLIKEKKTKSAQTLNEFYAAWKAHNWFISSWGWANSINTIVFSSFQKKWWWYNGTIYHIMALLNLYRKCKMWSGRYTESRVTSIASVTYTEYYSHLTPS